MKSQFTDSRVTIKDDGYSLIDNPEGARVGQWEY